MKELLGFLIGLIVRIISSKTVRRQFLSSKISDRQSHQIQSKTLASEPYSQLNVTGGKISSTGKYRIELSPCISIIIINNQVQLIKCLFSRSVQSMYFLEI